MIFDMLMVGITALLTGVFGVLPDLPPMPTIVESSATWLIDLVENVSGIFYYLYGSGTLFLAVMTAVIALFNFEHLYHLTMWIIRKLPISSS